MAYTPYTLISAVLSDYDNVDPTDSDYAERRVRLLTYLQQVYDMVWHHREWEFKVRTKTDTLNAGDTSFSLPTDYEDIGTSGGLYMGSVGSPKTWVEEVSIQEMTRRLTVVGDAPALPDIFAIYYNVTNGPSVNFPAIGANAEYTLIYTGQPDTLTDEPDVQAQTFVPFAIPGRYHASVLLPGLVAKSQEGKGDAREWRAHFDEGLKAMVTRERPRKSVTQQFPATIPPLW